MPFDFWTCITVISHPLWIFRGQRGCLLSPLIVPVTHNFLGSFLSMLLPVM